MSAADAALRAAHPLDAERSPLLRALPDYLRQFEAHLQQAGAYWEASQARMATCAQLLSEQEVQALSIDAATSNVEVRCWPGLAGIWRALAWTCQLWQRLWLGLECSGPA